MDCQIRRVDGIAEVVLVGSLDSSWSSYLSDRIDEVVRGGALEVRIDMAGVSYLSSNGIALLVRYHKQLRQIGGRLRIVADSEAVNHVLRLTGVTQILGDDVPAPVSGTDGAARCEVVERQGMALQIFPRASGGGVEHGPFSRRGLLTAETNRPLRKQRWLGAGRRGTIGGAGRSATP